MNYIQKYIMNNLTSLSTLKEKIDFLKSRKMHFRKICKTLGISLKEYQSVIYGNSQMTRIAYMKKQREKMQAKPFYLLKTRVRCFQHKKGQTPIKPFTYLDVIKKFGENPVCYLSGRSIDYNAKGYNLDHLVPISKGGSNELDNMGICLQESNFAKHTQTKEELLKLCKDIIKYQESLK